MVSSALFSFSIKKVMVFDKRLFIYLELVLIATVNTSDGGNKSMEPSSFYLKKNSRISIHQP